MCVKPPQNKQTKKEYKKLPKNIFFTEYIRVFPSYVHDCVVSNQLQQADIGSVCSAVRLWHHSACYSKPLQTLLPSWALSSIGCLLSTLTSKSYKPGGLTPSSGSNFLGKSEQSLQERKRHEWSPTAPRLAPWNYKRFSRPVSPRLKSISEWRRCKKLVVLFGLTGEDTCLGLE